MEDKKHNCSSKEHKEIGAISFCPKCNIFMCNKCILLHSQILGEHNLYYLNKDFNDEIFINFCNLNNHNEIFKFYCKNHNQLCCSYCICKFKNKELGQHSDCDICLINDIKEEKKNKLKDNIILLKELSKNINESISEIKTIFEKINNSKEELKIKIQIIFTKIRKAVNDREDELLLDIENKFKEIHFNEDTIKESEKLTNKIKITLEKGEKLDKEYDTNNDNKINAFINNCINIENYIKEINRINSNIKNCKDIKTFEVKFFTDDENRINQMIDSIKSYGIIYYKDALNYSKIIDNKEYIDLIKNWINPNGNIIISELLYRLSDNGEKVSKFHELCDNQGPTLTLFHVNDENKVGIYTPSSWKSKSIKKTDADTFIFNLNKKTKYNQRKNADYSILCDEKYGPYVFCLGIYEIEKMTAIYYYPKYINNCFEKGSDILPDYGKRYLSLKEVEIFKILIEK